jgi:hypothetical protein
MGSPEMNPETNATRTGGPNEVNQVFTVATGYGHVSRCGCGWRALHQTNIEGLVSGQRHLRTHASEAAK